MNKKGRTTSIDILEIIKMGIIIIIGAFIIVSLISTLFLN